MIVFKEDTNPKKEQRHVLIAFLDVISLVRKPQIVSTARKVKHRQKLGEKMAVIFALLDVIKPMQQLLRASIAFLVNFRTPL